MSSTGVTDNSWRTACNDVIRRRGSSTSYGIGVNELWVFRAMSNDVPAISRPRHSASVDERSASQSSCQRAMEEATSCPPAHGQVLLRCYTHRILGSGGIPSGKKSRHSRASLAEPSRPYTPMDRSLFHHNELTARPSSAYGGGFSGTENSWVNAAFSQRLGTGFQPTIAEEFVCFIVSYFSGSRTNGTRGDY